MAQTKNPLIDQQPMLKAEDFTFSLDADVRTTEFRSPGAISEKLPQRHRLCVIRGADVLGVLVEPARWREMEAAATMLAQQVTDVERTVEGTVAV